MADAVGVRLRTWQDYEAGNTVPTGRVYAKICARGIDGSWLLGAESPMTVVGRATGDDDVVALPRYDIEVAAGEGAVVESEPIADWIYFRRDWLRLQLGVSANHLVVVKAVGDSMSPTIEEGDLLLVDISDKRWSRDGVYVLRIDDSLVVKRVAKSSRGAVLVSSDNPLYRQHFEEFLGDLGKFQIVGRVVWVGGRI